MTMYKGRPPLDRPTGMNLNMKTTEPMEEAIRVIGFHTSNGNRSAIVREALDFYARALLVQAGSPLDCDPSPDRS